METPSKARSHRVAALVAELGALASELTRLSATAGEACAAGDIDALSEGSERILQAQVSYAERYRTILVVRLRGPRSFPSGADLMSL